MKVKATSENHARTNRRSTTLKENGRPGRTGRTTGAPQPKNPGAEWKLRLYVAGQTPKSLAAFANLKKLCEQYLANRYSIEVVDLSTQPQLAGNDQIVALPTLVRKLPEPMKRVIGDLSNAERVLVSIDLAPIPKS